MAPEIPNEIGLEDLNSKEFIDNKVAEIQKVVGSGTAFNALSGGVDSSTVAMLAYKALGDKVKHFFIDHDLMRKGEPEYIAQAFKKLGAHIEVIDAKEIFYGRLKGLANHEDKRHAITAAFYQDVFPDLIKKIGAKYLLHGTILTDIEESVAGIKSQHNILTQLGINTEEQFGYTLIEPLKELRKPAVRVVAEALGLPKEIYDRMPFPGPALAARIQGGVTPEYVAMIKEATAIAEPILAETGAFQYFPILKEGRIPGIINGVGFLGYEMEIRCWDTMDAVTSEERELPWDMLKKLDREIRKAVPEVISVTHGITPKPPNSMEIV